MLSTIRQSCVSHYDAILTAIESEPPAELKKTLGYIASFLMAAETAITTEIGADKSDV